MKDQTPQKVGTQVRQERLYLADRMALRPAEVAKALGVSVRLVRQLLPEIPHVRLGGCVVVPTDLLKEWLHERVRSEGASIKELADRAITAIGARREH